MLNRKSDTFGHLPWLADYIRTVPGLGAKMKQMRGFCIERTEERVKRGGAFRKDLFYYLVRQLPLLLAITELLIVRYRIMKTGWSLRHCYLKSWRTGRWL